MFAKAGVTRTNIYNVRETFADHSWSIGYQYRRIIMVPRPEPLCGSIGMINLGIGTKSLIENQLDLGVERGRY